MVTVPTVSSFTKPETENAVEPDTGVVKAVPLALFTLSAVMVNATAVILAVEVGCVRV